MNMYERLCKDMKSGDGAAASIVPSLSGLADLANATASGKFLSAFETSRNWESSGFKDIDQRIRPLDRRFNDMDQRKSILAPGANDIDERRLDRPGPLSSAFPSASSAPPAMNSGSSNLDIKDSSLVEILQALNDEALTEQILGQMSPSECVLFLQTLISEAGRKGFLDMNARIPELDIDERQAPGNPPVPFPLLSVIPDVTTPHRSSTPILPVREEFQALPPASLLPVREEFRTPPVVIPVPLLDLDERVAEIPGLITCEREETLLSFREGLSRGNAIDKTISNQKVSLKSNDTPLIGSDTPKSVGHLDLAAKSSFTSDINCATTDASLDVPKSTPDINEVVVLPKSQKTIEQESLMDRMKEELNLIEILVAIQSELVGIQPALTAEFKAAAASQLENAGVAVQSSTPCSSTGRRMNAQGEESQDSETAKSNTADGGKVNKLLSASYSAYCQLTILPTAS